MLRHQPDCSAAIGLPDLCTCGAVREFAARALAAQAAAQPSPARPRDWTAYLLHGFCAPGAPLHPANDFDAAPPSAFAADRP